MKALNKISIGNATLYHGVACAKSGRQFVGIEKEKKYFDIAVQRMKEEYEKTDI